MYELWGKASRHNRRHAEDGGSGDAGKGEGENAVKLWLYSLVDNVQRGRSDLSESTGMHADACMSSRLETYHEDKKGTVSQIQSKCS